MAYIAEDGEQSIYLWAGHAVAYVVEEKNYGWNGKHLGWFVDGIFYDGHGYKIGFIRSKCPVATFAEPAKSRCLVLPSWLNLPDSQASLLVQH